MSKPNNLQYLLDRPEPSEILLRARHLAGLQMQKLFQSNNPNGQTSNREEFRWIKTELTYPSFDDMCFAYKSSLFSVVVEIMDEDGNLYSRISKSTQIEACEENNLIPCVFKVKSKQKHSLSRQYKNERNSIDYKLTAFEDGWNLYNSKTNQPINPFLDAVADLVLMSKWEIHSFVVLITRLKIEKEGLNILSFCDLPDIHPQIWFQDRDGNKCWVITKRIDNADNLDYSQWKGYENTNPELKNYNGYFAGVQINFDATNSSKELYRGSVINFDYKGLEKIYVS